MEKEELKQRCLDAIDANRDLIIQLGDDVYKTPELGYKEFKTTERMIKAFQEIGEEPETEIAYTGCKVSTPKKGNTRIAVIGELDCIQCKEHPDSTPEGNVHACGHHAQLADLYGCAIGLLRSGVMKELERIIGRCSNSYERLSKAKELAAHLLPVIVPLVVPFTTTLTPIIGSPFLSFTIPCTCNP